MTSILKLSGFAGFFGKLFRRKTLTHKEIYEYKN